MFLGFEEKGADMTKTKSTIQDRFNQFHFDNPHIYYLLLKLTDEQHKRGKIRCGIRTFYEYIRWNVSLGKVKINGVFKLNDNYTSRYVRLLVRANPQYKHMVRLRTLRSE
jgi:hypothetical protein